MASRLQQRGLVILDRIVGPTHLIALLLVFMGRNLSLNRTIGTMLLFRYNKLVWRPMVSDTVYVPIKGLLTRPLLTMRQREHLLEPRTIFKLYRDIYSQLV
jgi:hypothetical protein